MINWRGVLAVENTWTEDGRRIRGTDISGTGLVIYRLPTLGKPTNVAGVISRMWRDGDLIRGEGQMRPEYAGQRLTGGADIDGTTQGGWTFADEGMTLDGGRMTGFTIHTNPTWPQVEIIVDPEQSSRSTDDQTRPRNGAGITKGRRGMTQPSDDGQPARLTYVMGADTQVDIGYRAGPVWRVPTGSGYKIVTEQQLVLVPEMLQYAPADAIVLDAEVAPALRAVMRHTVGQIRRAVAVLRPFLPDEEDDLVLAGERGAEAISVMRRAAEGATNPLHPDIRPGRFRPRATLEAVQVPAGEAGTAYQAAIARWCGGRIGQVAGRIYLRDADRSASEDSYADPGEWIIRGVTGLFFKRGPEEFGRDYEPVTGS